MNTILNKCTNGKVFKCGSCNKIHIEYKNIALNFSNEEYNQFARYFRNLDGQYWEQVNYNSEYKRKIIVPIGHKNLNILLNNNELIELKQLLYNNKNINTYPIIRSSEINKSFMLN
jgi:hypothetical protein